MFDFTVHYLTAAQSEVTWEIVDFCPGKKKKKKKVARGYDFLVLYVGHRSALFLT